MSFVVKRHLYIANTLEIMRVKEAAELLPFL